ncbi:TIGR01777 family oxidoreductase [Chitinophaga sedimenti]|uniref:TIGR01777 family oxidoreductase n=1 Tax=Chitinophaga sedimenti TaxID=2033606 RepID=UPI002004DB0D|nr:TIGR01777 family oxidoreductase [Chitinophaga sedimenti]MCK7557658.1 TIGR01777 family oxidoreductase [Chitinophaga sedimenti]
MKNKKIVIAGGTGFIGEALVHFFGTDNEVVVLSRSGSRKLPARYVTWNGETLSGWEQELDGADLLINLAGKSVNCRYTESNKAAIFASRVNSTTILGEAVKHAANPPKLWINTASATIYRHAEDRPQDEFTGEMHNDFSVQVCKLWEKTFFEQDTPGTRKVALRTAITLGPNGGVMAPFLNLVKFGLGGRQGKGSQMFSWVHVEDFCRLTNWLFETETAQGVYNCAAPQPVTNETFMRTLRQVAGHKIGLPAPEWLLRMGAVLIGTEIELIIKSRWVVPARLQQEGFRFRYAQLAPALEAIVNELPRRRYHLF